MKTILVDDEHIMLTQLEFEVNGINGVEIAGKFEDPFDALEFIKENKDVKLAFLDVGLPVMTGIELEKNIRKIIPDITIIFVSAFDSEDSESAKEVMKHLVYKPYTRKTIEAEMRNCGLIQ